MKSKILPVLIVLGIFIFAGSCYYDNMESLYPSTGTGCDTVSVTFDADIYPLLNNSCLSCHSNNTAPSFGNNIALENYSDVVSRSDQVLGSVRHTSGYSPMPKNGGMVSSCFILKLETWINRGMPRN